MVYKAYKFDRSINKEVLAETGRAINKKEMREYVLSSKSLQDFIKIEYGKKSYTLNDIYAGR